MANTSTNVWDQKVLFNQMILRNILNGREGLVTTELRVAEAALTNEQQDDTVCFLMHETEDLFLLPDANVYRL